METFGVGSAFSLLNGLLTTFFATLGTTLENLLSSIPGFGKDIASIDAEIAKIGSLDNFLDFDIFSLNINPSFLPFSITWFSFFSYTWQVWVLGLLLLLLLNVSKEFYMAEIEAAVRSALWSLGSVSLSVLIELNSYATVLSTCR